MSDVVTTESVQSASAQYEAYPTMEIGRKIDVARFEIAGLEKKAAEFRAFFEASVARLNGERDTEQRECRGRIKAYEDMIAKLHDQVATAESRCRDETARIGATVDNEVDQIHRMIAGNRAMLEALIE
jgi:hypothetical protein